VRTARASCGAARRSADLWPGLRRAVHRTSSTCVVVLTVGVLTGCAGAGASGPTTATVGVSTTNAVAFAHAVNLRASDLPSMEVVAPERAAPSPGATAIGFARCDRGINPARILVSIRSTLLSAGDERDRRLVISRVTVMPSEALARRNLAAFTSRRGLRCERHYGGTSISRLSVALPGGARAVGQRIVAPSEGPTHVVGYHDIVGFVHGPAEIVLTAAGFSHPVRTQTEQALLGALFRRATQARGEL
jgi:hypothetical protein